MSANLLRRLAVAAIGIPAALGIVYVGGWALTALVAFLGVAGTAEVYRLALAGGTRPVAVVGFLGAAAAPVAAYGVSVGSPVGDPGWLTLGAAGWLMAAMLAVTATRRPTERPLAALGITVVGALYAGGLPAFIIVLRHGTAVPSAWGALWLVVLPLAVTWIADSAAMLGGSLVGGPQLAPVVSPKKTWAGAVAGAGSAVIVAPVFGALAFEPHGIELSWWQLGVFGLAVSVMGQLGDAVESLFKREVGVKDSGAFFPGHGGVLDRLDSLYWVLPTSVVLYRGFGLL